MNEIKSQGQCTKDVQLFSLVVQLFSLVVQLFNCCTAFLKYIYEDHRICTALEKLYILLETKLWMKLRAKDSVPKMYSFFLWLYSFLMVVQLFKNIYMRTTEFVQLWRKLYILLQTPLWMKLSAKDSVQKMYSFFLCFYSFLIVVHLFKNISIRTTEFIQLWKKLYFLVETPLWMKLRAKESVPKMYSFFVWLYSFLMVVQLFKNTYMRTTEFVQLWRKLYILVQTPLWMKLRAKYSVPKMYSFFLWLYSFSIVLQLFENIYMRTTEFVQLWKNCIFWYKHHCEWN